jgi:hypothetical protein
VYPQLDVVQSTFGGAKAAKTLPKVTKKTTPADIAQSTYNWAESLASERGVRDVRTIAGMAKVVQAMLPTKPTGAEVVTALETRFPRLKAPTASVEEPEEIVQQEPIAPQPATPVAPQPTTPVAPQPAV